MNSAADGQRLFFALWPDEALRHTLYKETRRAVRASGGKPVPAENFHITLAFLGHLDAAGALAANAAAEATTGEGFDLVLDRMGFWADARVAWLGAQTIPEAGSRFAAALREALRTRGIAVDIRPFLPHVTLARKVSKPGSLGTLRPIRWPVREFVLVHSIPNRHTSEYRPLTSWPLRAPAAAAAEL
ncbi:MAG: RNA 2',3'-cyclic phosphodiesterase [Gammaproteobacteria bacterium]|nr:RNA 2',3'-cyclic phosphodiesterase [Gammaproteobacteria bacterium]MBU6510643.1 RNA 2',3'-cyclic phosphodiesterase [Gammaproteobacteria bacterium]MDE1984776.1 RNA 2',3'-cyclic phosphodiesterase [Gammaproteobacteria bacterium]MDE2109165.1 RNA 2',3'-cyclic phosphodiesterase [Gammaproteobacteria bacterium]MDE2460800.1 RNA 2',3'-cyclic phosphodiesterase [Gammaproteobacteria bacterium]